MAKAMWISPLKKKADIVATTIIPLTTAHGGRPMHTMIVTKSETPVEDVTAKTSRRRETALETLANFIQAPQPAPPPVPKLSSIDAMTFRHLNGQLLIVMQTGSATSR